MDGLVRRGGGEEGGVGQRGSSNPRRLINKVHYRHPAGFQLKLMETACNKLINILNKQNKCFKVVIIEVKHHKNLRIYASFTRSFVLQDSQHENKNFQSGRNNNLIGAVATYAAAV